MSSKSKKSVEKRFREVMEEFLCDMKLEESDIIRQINEDLPGILEIFFSDDDGLSFALEESGNPETWGDQTVKDYVGNYSDFFDRFSDKNLNRRVYQPIYNEIIRWNRKGEPESIVEDDLPIDALYTGNIEEALLSSYELHREHGVSNGDILRLGYFDLTNEVLVIYEDAGIFTAFRFGMTEERNPNDLFKECVEDTPKLYRKYNNLRLLRPVWNFGLNGDKTKQMDVDYYVYNINPSTDSFTCCSVEKILEKMKE